MVLHTGWAANVTARIDIVQRLMFMSESGVTVKSQDISKKTFPAPKFLVCSPVHLESGFHFCSACCYISWQAFNSRGSWLAIGTAGQAMLSG